MAPSGSTANANQHEARVQQVINAAIAEAREEITRRSRRDPKWHGSVGVVFHVIDGVVDRFTTELKTSVKARDAV